MKYILAGILLLLCGYAVAQFTTKLYVSKQYEGGGDRIYFIQDLETNTRCYAITNQGGVGGGYGISCVKN